MKWNEFISNSFVGQSVNNTSQNRHIYTSKSSHGSKWTVSHSSDAAPAEILSLVCINLCVSASTASPEDKRSEDRWGAKGKLEEPDVNPCGMPRYGRVAQIAFWLKICFQREIWSGQVLLLCVKMTLHLSESWLINRNRCSVLTTQLHPVILPCYRGEIMSAWDILFPAGRLVEGRAGVFRAAVSDSLQKPEIFWRTRHQCLCSVKQREVFSKLCSLWQIDVMRE